MSFFTALSLSFNNLRTKKGRTLLTSFAGSIGIIGIALILSISTGIQAYVNGIQRDTLSSYPISVTREDNTLISGLMSANGEMGGEAPEEHANDAVYSSAGMYRLFNAVFADDGTENDLTAFKAWIDGEMNGDKASTELSSLASAVQYGYDVDLNTYVKRGDGSYASTSLNDAVSIGTADGGSENALSSVLSARLSNMDSWSEMIPGTGGELISDMVYDQYELVDGRWPESAKEIVMILDERNEASDIAFFTLGLMDQEEVNEMFTSAVQGKEVESEQKMISYSDVLDTEFKLVLNAEYYSKDADGRWKDIRNDEGALDLVVKNGYDLKIVGILKPDPEATSSSITGTFAYTSALTDYVIERTAQCEIVKEQLLPDNSNFDVLTGLPFVITESIDPDDGEKAEKVKEYFASLNAAEKEDIYTSILGTPSDEYLDKTVQTLMAQYPTRDSMMKLAMGTYNIDESVATSYFADMTDEEMTVLLKEKLGETVKERYLESAKTQVSAIKANASTPDDIFGAKGTAAVALAFDTLIASTDDISVLADYYDEYMPGTVSGSTLAETLRTLGSIDPDCPDSVNIYAASFEDKEEIDALIADYNENASEDERIKYTDYVALLMSGVTTMIDAVSYGLIGFVSISLVVSSIMIGIITYISVLERTKEIGILRSVGASKKDISRVFNAETVIVGFTAGIIGIGMTVLLNIPISIIAKKLTGISNIAVLPTTAGVILVAISIILTVIAGLIPSRLAAKKDPVIALRTE